MNKFAILVILLGGAIAAFGASEYINYRWDFSSKMELGVGIAIIVIGLLLRGSARWR